MEYTIGALAKVSGLTIRTIRYYDQIGLLSPCRISSGGYRIYGRAEVDRLQQILFYREMGFDLATVKELIDGGGYDKKAALEGHLISLLAEKRRIEALIQNVSKTLAEYEGGEKMSDREKFEGFKSELIRENEKNYGGELREKYGASLIDESNKKFLGQSQERYALARELEAEIKSRLAAAAPSGDPSGTEAQEICRLHEKWLRIFWPEGAYSKQAHLNLGEMYAEDERFKKYYDGITPGGARFLRDTLRVYCA